MQKKGVTRVLILGIIDIITMAITYFASYKILSAVGFELNSKFLIFIPAFILIKIFLYALLGLYKSNSRGLILECIIIVVSNAVVFSLIQFVLKFSGTLYINLAAVTVDLVVETISRSIFSNHKIKNEEEIPDYEGYNDLYDDLGENLNMNNDYTQDEYYDDNSYIEEDQGDYATNEDYYDEGNEEYYENQAQDAYDENYDPYYDEEDTYEQESNANINEEAIDQLNYYKEKLRDMAKSLEQKTAMLHEKENELEAKSNDLLNKESLLKEKEEKLSQANLSSKNQFSELTSIKDTNQNLLEELSSKEERALNAEKENQKLKKEIEDRIAEEERLLKEKNDILEQNSDILEEIEFNKKLIEEKENKLTSLNENLENQKEYIKQLEDNFFSLFSEGNKNNLGEELNPKDSFKNKYNMIDPVLSDMEHIYTCLIDRFKKLKEIEKEQSENPITEKLKSIKNQEQELKDIKDKISAKEIFLNKKYAKLTKKEKEVEDILVALKEKLNNLEDNTQNGKVVPKSTDNTVSVKEDILSSVDELLKDLSLDDDFSNSISSDLNNLSDNSNNRDDNFSIDLENDDLSLDIDFDDFDNTNSLYEDSSLEAIDLEEEYESL